MKIVVIGILGTLAALVLKRNNPELGLVLTVGVAMLLAYFALSALTSVLEFVNRLAEMASLSPAVITPVLKTVGIAVVTKIAADVCRDAKETAVASAVELCGAAVALYMLLPLLSMVMKLITSFV